MMEKRTLARPYAKAIFSLAADTNTFDQWSRALNLLSVIAQDENAKNFIEDSTQLPINITNFLEQMCQDVLNDTLKNFIGVLVQQKRLSLLVEIDILYEAMRFEREGKIDVKFYSKCLLTETQKTRFTALLSSYFKRTVTIVWLCDETLFGGFLIKVGNETWDSSLRGQLTALKAVVSD